MNRCPPGTIRKGNRCVPRCSAPHISEVEYLWYKDSRGNPGLHISIPACDKAKIDEVSDALTVLDDIGIVFDTSYGSEGVMDWMFDWSLHGRHFIFDEDTKEYVELERRTPRADEHIEEKREARRAMREIIETFPPPEAISC